MQQFDKVPIDKEQTLKNIMNNNTTKVTNEPKTKATRSATPKISKKTLKDVLKQTQPPTMKKARQSTSNTTDLKEKEDLIIKVINYQNSSRFGTQIRKELKMNFSRDQLAKKTTQEIDNVLYRIRNFLNNRGLSGIYEQMAKTTAVGYENIVSEFYDITGFSDLLLNNPAFWDEFEMWKCERSLPDIPPSLQLMYIVSSTTLMAHYKNIAMTSGNNNKDDNVKAKQFGRFQNKPKKQNIEK